MVTILNQYLNERMTFNIWTKVVYLYNKSSTKEWDWLIATLDFDEQLHKTEHRKQNMVTE